MYVSIYVDRSMYVCVQLSYSGKGLLNYEKNVVLHRINQYSGTIVTYIIPQKTIENADSMLLIELLQITFRHRNA